MHSYLHLISVQCDMWPRTCLSSRLHVFKQKFNFFRPFLPEIRLSNAYKVNSKAQERSASVEETEHDES